MNVSYEVSIVDLVSLALASGALTLGVVNYVTELFRRKPRAEVTFRNYLDTAGREGLSITVANTGETPFTISGVGLVLGGNKRLHPLAKWGDELPKVLHPGETCETVVDRSCYTDDPTLKVKCAFARTALGKEFYSQRLSKKFLGIK
jgi:hypothetical protein